LASDPDCESRGRERGACSSYREEFRTELGVSKWNLIPFYALFSLHIQYSDLELKHEEKVVPATYLFWLEITEMEVWQRCVYGYAYSDFDFIP
jgi:hypothetical protein